MAGLARGAESRSPRALLRAAEGQRGTHPIQRQRSPSCPLQASCCPITAPSLDQIHGDCNPSALTTAAPEHTLLPAPPAPPALSQLPMAHSSMPGATSAPVR